MATPASSIAHTEGSGALETLADSETLKLPLL
jgi:hypothetical protein